MGYFDFFQRCGRIFCVRIWSCAQKSLSLCKSTLLLRWQRPAPGMLDDEEENFGLLRESDLGLEEEVRHIKDDNELLERAREIVDKKAAKERAKSRTKRTPKNEEASEEDAWLDSFDTPGLEVNAPDDSEVDFLT